VDEDVTVVALDRRRAVRRHGPEVMVSVLGPVLIRAACEEIKMSPLERATLVRLTLAGGRPVPDLRLAADLWGHREMRSPVPRLRVVVSRLRSALGPHRDVVTRTPSGYRTDVCAVDLEVAEAAARRLYAAQRAGRDESVLEAAEEALRQWRGPALACLESVPFAQAEADRLDEWRLDLLEAKFEAGSRLRSDIECIPALAALVAQHPLRETLTRAYALALYRAGRQTAALDCLRRLRRALADEYGVDPTPETTQLLLGILRHDPVLRSRQPAETTGTKHVATMDSVVAGHRRRHHGTGNPSNYVAESAGVQTHRRRSGEEFGALAEHSVF
jgi:DNA-binding SARP family transcriptional activator